MHYIVYVWYGPDFCRNSLPVHWVQSWKFGVVRTPYACCSVTQPRVQLSAHNVFDCVVSAKWWGRRVVTVVHDSLACIVFACTTFQTRLTQSAIKVDQENYCINTLPNWYASERRGTCHVKPPATPELIQSNWPCSRVLPGTSPPFVALFQALTPCKPIFNPTFSILKHLLQGTYRVVVFFGVLRSFVSNNYIIGRPKPAVASYADHHCNLKIYSDHLQLSRRVSAYVCRMGPRLQDAKFSEL